MRPDTTRGSKTKAAQAADRTALILHFENNDLLPELYGDHDRHLARIEQKLAVTIAPRGNRVAIGGTGDRTAAGEVLRALYQRLERGEPVTLGDVDGAIRLAGEGVDPSSENLRFRTRRRLIVPRSPTQARYMAALAKHDLVFGLGPAGTGKTYLAVGAAVTLLLAGKVDRIVLTRPAVEAGERLGFLPGDMREKVDPYLRPLFDALEDMLPGEQMTQWLESGKIEVAPLAFMRGRTLSHSFIILDEAQNATPMQMKMFLTRLGEHSRMAVTGDPSQTDLPLGTVSGLADALEVLEDVEEVPVVRFGEADVVRHPMVARIVRAYEARERRRR